MVGPHTIPFDLCFSLVVFALGTEPGLLVKDGGDGIVKLFGNGCGAVDVSGLGGER
jgi:hypothetical protein